MGYLYNYRRSLWPLQPKSCAFGIWLARFWSATSAKRLYDLLKTVGMEFINLIFGILLNSISEK